MFDQLGNELTSNFKDIIKECIIACSDVRIEINDFARYEPQGNPIEVGMINFLIDNQEDVPLRLIQRNQF